MQNRENVNLVSVLLPLLGATVLFYADLYLIDKGETLDRVAFLSVITSLLVYYLFNVKLIQLSRRKGVIFLQVIVLAIVAAKAFYVRNFISKYHLIFGYGLLLAGLLVSLVVFFKKHFKLSIYETFNVFTDKDEYVLGEGVNVCIEIDPKNNYFINRLDISLVMSENTSGIRGHVVDETVFSLTETLIEKENINSYKKLDVLLEIPTDGMSSFYGIYNSIFWYVKLTTVISGKETELTTLIDVKPEILLRGLGNE
jgi:hypothetical protein